MLGGWFTKGSDDARYLAAKESRGVRSGVKAWEQSTYWGICGCWTLTIILLIALPIAIIGAQQRTHRGLPEGSVDLISGKGTTLKTVYSDCPGGACPPPPFPPDFPCERWGGRCVDDPTRIQTAGQDNFVPGSMTPAQMQTFKTTCIQELAKLDPIVQAVDRDVTRVSLRCNKQSSYGAHGYGQSCCMHNPCMLLKGGVCVDKSVVAASANPAITIASEVSTNYQADIVPYKHLEWSPTIDQDLDGCPREGPTQSNPSPKSKTGKPCKKHWFYKGFCPGITNPNVQCLAPACEARGGTCMGGGTATIGRGCGSTKSNPTWTQAQSTISTGGTPDFWYGVQGANSQATDGTQWAPCPKYDDTCCINNPCETLFGGKCVKRDPYLSSSDPWWNDHYYEGAQPSLAKAKADKTYDETTEWDGAGNHWVRGICNGPSDVQCWAPPGS